MPDMILQREKFKPTHRSDAGVVFSWVDTAGALEAMGINCRLLVPDFATDGGVH